MEPQNKTKVLTYVRNYALIIIGCFVLAFGDAAFISPLGLVTGGVLSIGVIVQRFVGSGFYLVDIVVWAVQILLLGVSFLFLGKRFTLRSLFATLLYPAFFSFLSRAPIVNGVSIGNHIAAYFLTWPKDWSLIVLAGLAGGALIGGGVAICYHGGGSTGGLDVISVILAKKTPIKESASAFIIDGSLVIIGIFCTQDLISGLVGVLSAFACAIAVQLIYVNASAYIIADIISEKYETIQEYVHQKMDHATTQIQAVGGYTKQEKVILRVAFSKREFASFRSYIALTDPKAFVTFTQASMIHGEGFTPLEGEGVLSKNKSENGDLHG